MFQLQPIDAYTVLGCTYKISKISNEAGQLVAVLHRDNLEDLRFWSRTSDSASSSIRDSILAIYCTKPLPTRHHLETEDSC